MGNENEVDDFHIQGCRRGDARTDRCICGLDASRTPTYQSTAQVGEVFGISEQAVANFARGREWPHFRIGRKVLFTVEHIHQIAALNERPVVRDASVEAAGSHGQRTRRTRATPKGVRS